LPAGTGAVANGIVLNTTDLPHGHTSLAIIVTTMRATTAYADRVSDELQEGEAARANGKNRRPTSFEPMHHKQQCKTALDFMRRPPHKASLFTFFAASRRPITEEHFAHNSHRKASSDFVNLNFPA
jgi:hypothetical protein